MSIVVITNTGDFLEPYELVPRISHYPVLPDQERRDPGKGSSRATLTIEGPLRSNQTICRVEFKASHYDCHYPRRLKAISNRIYSNVNLKIKQVCFKAIYRGHDVIAVLPAGYMESQSQVIFFLRFSVTKSTVNVWQRSLFPCVFFLLWMRSIKQMQETYERLLTNLQLSRNKTTAVSEEKLDEDKYDIRDKKQPLGSNKLCLPAALIK